MSIKIPKEVKKEFRDGFNNYIKDMGRPITVQLEPVKVNCPNCLYDSIQQKSSNVYDSSFKLPVNIFPGTSFQETIFPQPFNVISVSGVQYNPANVNPKILKTTICPVCNGEGLLTKENTTCIQAVITNGLTSQGLTEQGIIDLSAGKDGLLYTRLKTYAKNFALLKKAKFFIIDGIPMKIEVPPRQKGLGNVDIAEVYVSEIETDISVSNKFDNDPRLNINPIGTMSNQADISTPTIPPVTTGDDVW